MRVFTPVCAAAILALGLTACASSPYDTAQTRCERNRQSDQVAGAAVGAALGALAGSAIAGNSSNTEGTIAGAVVGGAVGSQVAKGSPCPPGYSYYEPGYRY
jgi:uncharacterized protein YcfJ